MNEVERIRAFSRELADSVAGRVVPSPVGDALFVDDLPDVYVLNYLRADRGGAAEIRAEAERALERVHHRKVLTYLDLELGWQRETHLVMAHRREPDRRVDTSHVRRVAFDAIAPERTYDYRDPHIGEELNEAQRRFARATGMHWLAAFDGDALAAWCHVRSDGQVAQIEDVNTLPAFRGRGHGRAVVQHALEEARGTHAHVFLEALEDDWPQELYRRLGFETVDRVHHHILPGHPLTALRVRTPRLELRLATVAELRALYRVAEAGIHDPGTMPFGNAWTDDLDEGAFVAFHRATVADWRPDDWKLALVAFLDGGPVGVQGLNAVDFAGTRAVQTGSWLGRAYQGRGLGTEMRSAVLSLAFDVLGAERAQSGAMTDNPQSLGVSRKLGYEQVGVSVVSPRGEPRDHVDVELRRERFRPAAPAEITGVDPALFGL